MTLPSGDPESELLSLLSGRPEAAPNSSPRRSYSGHRQHHHSTTALNSDRDTDLRRAHHAPRNRTLSLNVALEKSTMMVLMKDRQEVEERVEGGWGWVVVAASLACLCLLDGVSYSFGVLLTPLMAELQAGRVGVAAAGSLQTGIYALAGLCVAKLVTR
jgi:hypothetical protein